MRSRQRFTRHGSGAPRLFLLAMLIVLFVDPAYVHLVRPAVRPAVRPVLRPVFVSSVRLVVVCACCLLLLCVVL